MTRTLGVLMACLGLLGSIPAGSFDQKPMMITVMLYKTPPLMITAVSGGPDGKGGIIGRSTGGLITSQFPTAVVLLKLGGPADFNDENIHSVVNNNFVFKCGETLSEGLPADFFGKRIFIFENGLLKKTGTAKITTDTSNPPAESTELKLDLISIRGEKWILALRYELASSEGSKTAGKSRVLLDSIVDLQSTEPILIGFPYMDPQQGRFIYWLALSLDQAVDGLILRP
jgi:hypothetical protein